eukprot:CAMPEP_0114561226 /NCGR_PEP_ID=MMETSP0114-20121206/11889_1 /TAXON_ID=31324 /ORGANISM="Goniomonas sp, Strain m" /LENGTH=445 /DNA_ID=CAMNT_0001746843 /DNA_START=126 /DNA_END=1461 /DNA_ORIENTATION=-
MEGGWIILDCLDDVVKARLAITDALKERNIHVDGVVAFDEYGVHLASLVAEDLDLPGIPSAVTSATRNKLAFRTFCQENDLPHVRHWPLRSLEQLETLQLPFPCVFKPRCGAGSHFVRQVENMEELRSVYTAAVADLRGKPALYEWAVGPKEEEFFVEEFLQGNEVDIDVVCQNGEVVYTLITDNFPSHSRPFFLEMGGQAPSQLAPSAQAELLELAKNLLRTLGQGCSKGISGVFHIELLHTARGPVPIEVNCRLGGAEVYVLNKTVHGRDLGEAAACVACGVPVSESSPTPLTHCTSLNLVPDNCGRSLIKDQIVPEAVTKHPTYAGHALYWAEGDTILLPPDGYQYLGWLVACGSSASVARSNLQDLAHKIIVNIVSLADNRGPTRVDLVASPASTAPSSPTEADRLCAARSSQSSVNACAQALAQVLAEGCFGQCEIVVEP